MFGHQQVIDKLEKISDSLNTVKSNVDVIKNSVQTIDARGTTAGVNRGQKFAEMLDEHIKHLSEQKILLTESSKKVDRINKFLFGGGALSGAGGLIAYLNGFFS